MPKHTRHNVERWCVVAAERTIKKTITASGPPKDSGKLVTIMKIGPRLFRLCSFAASDAEVDDAGYSPPVPKPTMPLAMVIIQNMPLMVTPWAAVAKMPPMTIMRVVVMMANFRPR